MSLLIHAAVAGAFLVAANSESTIQPRRKQIPISSIETPVKPLQIDPIIDDLPIEPTFNEVAPPRLGALPALPEPTLSEPANSNIIAASVAPDASVNFGTTGPVSSAYRTRFCGATGAATRVCYVVDCSGSMLLAFDYVRAELKRAIAQLSPAQYFHFVFYAGGPARQLPPGSLRRANTRNRQAALLFVEGIELAKVPNHAVAGKAVAEAMSAALGVTDSSGQGAQLIYLLTDGAFEQGQVLERIGTLQARRAARAVINVIACGNNDHAGFLRQLAGNNGGQYRFVSDEQMTRPPKPSQSTTKTIAR